MFFLLDEKDLFWKKKKIEVLVMPYRKQHEPHMTVLELFNSAWRKKKKGKSDSVKFDPYPTKKNSVFEILINPFQTFFLLIDFNGMSIHPGLFNTQRLGNCIHFMLIFSVLCSCFLNFFFFFGIRSYRIQIIFKQIYLTLRCFLMAYRPS